MSSTISLFVGLAEWREGELEAAYRSIADSVSHQRAAGNYFYEAFGMAILADIRMAQGRLREAQAEEHLNRGDRDSRSRRPAGDYVSTLDRPGADRDSLGVGGEG